MESTVNTNDQRIKILRALSPRPLMSLEEDRKFFINCKDEIAKILLAIETYENAIVIGERGSGKTSFLNHVYHQILKDKKTLVIRFNILEIAEFNQINFLTGVFNEIVSNRYISNKIKLKNTLIKMHKFDQKQLQDYEYEPQKDDFYVALDRFSTLINFLKKDGIDVCIILDNTDKIDSTLIWNAFRGIRDTLWKLKVPIVLTALPNQVKKIIKIPLDHFFPYLIELKPIDSEGTYNLIQKRLDHSNFKVKTQEIVEEVSRRASGNPRNIIEIFKHLFEELEIKNSINKKQLESLGVLYSRKLPDIERAICNYLIRNPKTSASSQDFISTIGVTRSRLAQILNKLKKRGIIGSKKEGRIVTYFLTSYKREQREEHDSTTNEVKILEKSCMDHNGKYLEPEFLSINVGDKVIWENEDTAYHTITSGSPEKGADGMFDSALIMSGQKFEIKMDKKGTFTYFCALHPWKTGKITVHALS